MRKFALVFLVLLLTACGGGGGGDDDPSDQPNDPGQPGDTQKSWTYMVYLGGDNNLSTAGLLDLNEMETVGSTSEVNIVLQAEFSRQFTDFNAIGHGSYTGQTLRMLVQKDNDDGDVALEAATSIGNVNMASPATLTSFIRWATTTYPADHYALVIWDHGAGWKAAPLTKGAVEDTTSDSFMSLPDLAKGVADAGVHLDLLNFDACLMAMYEVAYEFRGLADYLVFSEETEPGDGDPYDTILAALTASPSMSPKTLATVIVDRFYDYYRNNPRQESITKSAIAMSYIDQLHQAVQGLAAALVDSYATSASAVQAALTNSQRYAYPTNYDLYDFCQSLTSEFPSGAVRSAANDVKAVLANGSFIVRNRSNGTSVSDSKGLAIFAPQANQISADDVVDEMREYAKLACNQSRATPWYDAVEELLAGRTSELVQGGFAFFIDWAGDADVDLYVWEPYGLYAPWGGQTTPNGFMSADSADTGVNEEYYVANDYVQPGQYDLFVYYYEDGLLSTSAAVNFYLYDPASSGDWQHFGPITLDNSNPYLGDFSDLSGPNDLNYFSDWWYPGYLERASNRGLPVVINGGDRQFNIFLKKKKRKPTLDQLRR